MQINQETFEAWLFSQPRAKEVNFGSCRHCFMGQFLVFMGHKYPFILPRQFLVGAEFQDLPDWFLTLTKGWSPTDETMIPFSAAQDKYMHLFPHHFAITDGTSRGDCSHLTGDIVVVTPAHNRETQPLQHIV